MQLDTTHQLLPGIQNALPSPQDFQKHESGNGQGRVKKQLEASQETKVIKIKITTGKVSQETRKREPGNAIQE